MSERVLSLSFHLLIIMRQIQLLLAVCIGTPPAGVVPDTPSTPSPTALSTTIILPTLADRSESCLLSTGSRPPVPPIGENEGSYSPRYVSVTPSLTTSVVFFLEVPPHPGSPNPRWQKPAWREGRFLE